MPRLGSFDGLRGLLAVYVMLSHLAPFAWTPGGWAWAAGLFTHGGAGVDAFFILSGLVITRSLQASRHRPLPFLIARAARIYPAFLAVFAVATVVQPLPTGFASMPWTPASGLAHDIWSTGWPAAWAPEWAAHLAMAHGLFPDGVLPDAWVSFLGAAWSLSTEWQFYILIALATRPRQLRGDRRLAWVFLATAAAGFAWASAAPIGWQFSRAFLPNKAHYFALGIASAAVASGRPRSVGAYGLALCAALGLCFAQGGVEKLAAPLAWTLCLAAQRWPDAPILRGIAFGLQSRPMAQLGTLSYGIYLVNEPIQKVAGWLIASCAGGNGVVFDALWLPAATLLPLLAAWALHRWVEAPGQRAGRRLAVRIADWRSPAAIRAAPSLGA